MSDSYIVLCVECIYIDTCNWCSKNEYYDAYNKKNILYIYNKKYIYGGGQMSNIKRTLCTI